MPAISPHEIPSGILEKTGTIHAMEFPPQGNTSDVAVLSAERGRFVLKRSAIRPFTDWLKREADVLAALAGTGLPVPAFHHFIQTDDEQGRLQTWLLMGHLPGEPIRQALARTDDPDAKRRILFEFGKSLRRLHAAPCPGPLLSGEPWLDRMLRQAEHRLRHDRVDGKPELLERLKNERPAAVGQALIHGDCTVENVLVHEGTVSGIIDWSGGAFGDPRYDLALAVRPIDDLFQSDEDLDAFFAGYGAPPISRAEFDYFNGLYEFFDGLTGFSRTHDLPSPARLSPSRGRRF